MEENPILVPALSVLHSKTPSIVPIMDESKHSTYVFIVGYIAILALLGILLWPYISAFVFAGILTGAFFPVHDFFSERFHFNPKISAILVCVLIVASIIAPTVYLVKELSGEAFNLYQQLKVNLTEEVLEEIFFGDGFLPRMLQDAFTLMNMDYNVTTLQSLILDAAKNTSTFMFDTVNDWISNIFLFLFEFIIMLVVIYSLLSEGKKIKAFVLELSPLPNEEEELMIRKFNQMNYVTLVGNGIGGVFQGVLATVGFWWAEISSLTLWMTSMIILAFIPLVGISIIYVPACIYLLVTGSTMKAIVLFIWCTAISLFVENWFKPKFVGDRVRINSVLVFLSIIGGMDVFGVAGIFYGPLIISIFLTFVELYHKRYSLKRPPENPATPRPS